MNKMRTHLRQLDQNSNNKINRRKLAERTGKKILFAIFRAAIIIGISYVIIGPLLGIIASSFFSTEDQYSPLTLLIPQNPTLERYELALMRMDYWPVLGRMIAYVLSLTAIQLVICGMAGYGFARFNFPLKKIMFACVIVSIVLPAHSIMYPLYTTFQSFNPLGIVGLFNNGNSVNLLNTVWPVYILSAFGVGLRSGLYIFIFTQFFRGLPKEIEEAALIDGSGNTRTFITIMVPNAIPAIITVTIFSIVWQYNDAFYGRLFGVSNNVLLSQRLITLGDTIANVDQIRDPSIISLYVYAGVVFMILPLLVMYIALQKYFVEGVERSGIVG